MPNIAPFQLYINAFKELGTSRQLANGIGPIPFGAIVEYHRIYDIGDFDEFLYFIRAMDDELLAIEDEKYKKQEAQNKLKNKKSSQSLTRK